MNVSKRGLKLVLCIQELNPFEYILLSVSFRSSPPCPWLKKMGKMRFLETPMFGVWQQFIYTVCNCCSSIQDQSVYKHLEKTFCEEIDRHSIEAWSIEVQNSTNVLSIESKVSKVTQSIENHT